MTEKRGHSIAEGFDLPPDAIKDVLLDGLVAAHFVDHRNQLVLETGFREI